jgi:hypothetical protein
MDPKFLKDVDSDSPDDEESGIYHQNFYSIK